MLLLAMICVSLVKARLALVLGLRLPPRIGRPSPNANAEPDTAIATTTTLAKSQGPLPELRKRLRMRLSIGWRPSLGVVVSGRVTRYPQQGGAHEGFGWRCKPPFTC